MLTNDEVYKNKNRFYSLLEKLEIERPDNDWEGLKQFLEESDFFIAPAATLFHNNFDGGLCDHTLNVYDSLVKLCEITPSVEGLFDWTSIAIVSLFHDLSKVNHYTRINKNKKVYCPSGRKHDSGGNFDWITVTEWGTKPLCQNFTYGSHEESSVFMLQNYVALSPLEITAILYHSGCQTDDFGKSKEVSYVFSSNKLASLLHLADTYSAFVIEDSGLLYE